jgi:hypothetical protein
MNLLICVKQHVVFSKNSCSTQENVWLTLSLHLPVIIGKEPAPKNGHAEIKMPSAFRDNGLFLNSPAIVGIFSTFRIERVSSKRKSHRK